jgi:hypothetical protein
MKNKSLQKRNITFYMLTVLFILIIVGFSLRNVDIDFPFAIIAVMAIAFGILGIILILLTIRIKESPKHRFFFVLTGASAVGIPLFVILHNFVYGLFIHLFGKDFWGNSTSGGDEAFFFILALLVCPICFVIGAVGSAVLLVKDGKDLS